MNNPNEWKEAIGKKSAIWNHVLLKIGDESITKCKYYSAKFNAKQATTLIIYHLEKKKLIVHQNQYKQN
ncbi:hypothetical protein A3Q56_00479 [Intoshia linei]|uniref:Uncharacterized protein n=1 Tax=Intoshia linei TaxID=1819745 RepID=A0A177BDV9_9BILA|nr:hypothetical protein A3Q56_00479 [Intoshia linei]